jgi:hypothetical protein
VAHTKPEKLDDLTKELDVIRAFVGLKEKSLGIFYYKSLPFLHFHDADQERWADVKINGAWSKIPIPFHATKKHRQSFLAAVRAAHKALLPRRKEVCEN